MLSKCWLIEQGGVQLPVVFVTMRDAVEYANQNLEGEYILIKDHFLEGEKRRSMVADKVDDKLKEV